MPIRRRDFLAASAAALTAPLMSGLASADAASAGATPWSRAFARLPPSLAALIDDPQYQVQLRWIRRARDAGGGSAPARRYDYGLAPRRWFSPASVVKLPMALLMAERLSAQGLDASASIRLRAAPETGEWPADEPLAETFRRGIDRTFATSENVPYNRWYDYLGADAVNARLAELGYPHARLIARLGSPDREANRRSVGGELIAVDGRALASTPTMQAQPRRFPFGRALAGRGWQNGDGSVTPGPRDFSYSNFLPLGDSLDMLDAFLAPERVPARRRWRIDGALRAQLLRALGLRPRESEDPRYPESEYYDGYVRWFFVGDGKARYPDGLRVLGKTGMAFGYLSEVAYAHDAASGAEFMLAASIHVNADGVYNDDQYEYDGIGLPFLAALGRAVLAVEREDRGVPAAIG